MFRLFTEVFVRSMQRAYKIIKARARARDFEGERDKATQRFRGREGEEKLREVGAEEER